MGRPTKFKPEYCEQAKKLCMLRAINDELADFFDVGITTLERWIKDHKEFRGAIKDGREKADAHVGESLYQRAMGYSHPDTHISNFKGQITVTPITKHYPPDPTSMIFWLKNRRPDLWRDRHEHTGAGGGPLIQTIERVIVEPDNTSD